MTETDNEVWRRGDSLEWNPVGAPERVVLEGRAIRLEPLRADLHGGALYRAAQGPGADPHLWDYLGYGPFSDESSFHTHLARQEASVDPLFFALIDRDSGTPQGVASLMRIDTANGVGEIGHIWFGADLQRTVAATEAIFLLADYLMTTLGYRRLEWKCDALNTRSRQAAARFGFTHEGIFRQHMVVKGRNRDTAWYAIVDREWPDRREAFVRWLDPTNFDRDGQQRQSLAAFRRRA